MSIVTHMLVTCSLEATLTTLMTSLHFGPSPSLLHYAIYRNYVLTYLIYSKDMLVVTMRRWKSTQMDRTTVVRRAIMLQLHGPSLSVGDQRTMNGYISSDRYGDFVVEDPLDSQWVGALRQHIREAEATALIWAAMYLLAHYPGRTAAICSKQS